jgi:hypothetical protein
MSTNLDFDHEMTSNNMTENQNSVFQMNETN